MSVVGNLTGGFDQTGTKNHARSLESPRIQKATDEARSRPYPGGDPLHRCSGPAKECVSTIPLLALVGRLAAFPECASEDPLNASHGSAVKTINYQRKS